MHDIALFRNDPARVRELLALRGADGSVVDRVLELDERRRALISAAEEKRARRNELSKQIPQLAKAGQPIDALKDESRRIGDDIAAGEGELAAVEAEQSGILMMLPNLPQEGVPLDRSAEANVVVRSVGEPRRFDFEPKPHWELAQALGILELERGTKLSGSGFYALRGQLAKLERVLINWFIDRHTAANGYTEVAVPNLVNRKTMTGTGQLPKFEDDLYRLPEDDLFLVPTAEVPVTNLHADEVLEEKALPIRYCAFTPCFRREAGGYGKENRGISRVHQFSKVEMVMFEHPDRSRAAHEELVGHATWFLDQLGLPYRVLLLSSGDMGFGAAKCYDIELWAPGMKTWLEVSSCSNFEDFQSRRAAIRFKPADGGKPRLAHTLNGSGLALPRLLITLLETFQNADGTITIPEVLRDRMGADRIG